MPHIDCRELGGFFGGRIQYAFRGRAQPLTVEPAQQGLLSTASFASDAPISVPWTGIREASWIESCMGSDLTVTVENEQTLQFYLPQDAVKIVQTNPCRTILQTIRRRFVSEPIERVDTNPKASILFAEAWCEPYGLGACCE